MRLTTFLSKSFWLAAVSLGLAACSLYESAGRKSLENNAYAIAGGTASLVACDSSPVTAAERLVFEDSNVLVYENQADGLQIRVDLKDGSQFSCRFQFLASEAVQSHLADVADFTLNRRQNRK